MSGESPEEVPEDLLKLLRAGQMLLVKYPVAARAAVRAFVAEGRRFAETEEGAAMRESLAGSALVRRGRMVWEGCSLNMLEEEGEVLLPTVLLEAVMAAAASSRLEGLLSRLFVEGGGAQRP
jgi:hypothetical protein